MSLRNANIGLVVDIVMTVVGLALVGFDPSDTELQIVCWSAIAVSITITFSLYWRDQRRRANRRSPR